GDIFAVHRPGDQRLVLQRLVHGHAARDRCAAGVAAGVAVGAIVADIDGVVGDAAGFEHVAQAHAGEGGAGHGTGGPLVAAGRGHKFGAPVAAALDGELIGVVLKALLEIGDGEALRVLAGLAANLEAPGGRVDLLDLGRNAVVAHEHVLGRSDVVV